MLNYLYGGIILYDYTYVYVDLPCMVLFGICLPRRSFVVLSCPVPLVCSPLLCYYIFSHPLAYYYSPSPLVSLICTYQKLYQADSVQCGALRPPCALDAV